MSGIRIDVQPQARSSPEQFETLLEYMETHGDIAKPQKGLQGRLKSDRLWQDVTELLNFVGGGVFKPVDRWKKVWADWKAKTKKKALAKKNEISGTGGGPSCRLVITVPEQRVLSLMGLSIVSGQVVEELGNIDQLQTLYPTELQSVNSFENDNLYVFVPISSEGNSAPAAAVTSKPSTPTSASVSAVTPLPPLSTSQATPRRTCGPPSPAASPSASTPRRRRILQRRERKVQTPFERSTNHFVEVENRRLQLEEERERNHHTREMERLRLDARRLDLNDFF